MKYFAERIWCEYASVDAEPDPSLWKMTHNGYNVSVYAIEESVMIEWQVGRQLYVSRWGYTKDWPGIVDAKQSIVSIIDRATSYAGAS
jgi:hypothetical protein